MSFYNRIDPVLIERILPNPLGKEQAGVYAQAFRLLDAGQNFALLFAVLLLPLFSKMISIRESVEKMVKLSFSIIISGSLIIAITLQFFATDLMQLMYDINPGESEQHFISRINQSATILKLLMVSFIAISTNYIFGTLLTANHNLKQLNLIALGGLVINITLNLILIPYLYSIGSAYASLATQSITAILQFLLVFKIFKFKINYKIFVNLVFLILALITIGYLLTQVINLRWELSFILMLISGLCVSIVLKLLNVKEFISIIKEK
jgi:O-antigen/teichoic acid export membrane protein